MPSHLVINYPTPASGGRLTNCISSDLLFHKKIVMPPGDADIAVSACKITKETLKSIFSNGFSHVKRFAEMLTAHSILSFPPQYTQQTHIKTSLELKHRGVNLE